MMLAVRGETTAILTGTIVDGGGQPIAGATVTIGTLPDYQTCLGYAGCGHPLAPLHVSRTNGKGHFSIPAACNPSPSYLPTDCFVRVAKPGYATLDLQFDTRTLSAGVRRIQKLRTAEIQLLALVNRYRRTAAIPHTPGDLVMDEALLDQARAWAAKTVANPNVWSDPLYLGKPGELVSWGWSVADQNGTPAEAISTFFSEQKNCPHYNWQTCVVAEDTGHYIGLADSSDAWIGITQSLKPYATGDLKGTYVFGGIMEGGQNGWRGGSAGL